MRKALAGFVLGAAVVVAGCAAPAEDEAGDQGAAQTTGKIVVDHVVIVPDGATFEGALVIGVTNAAKGKIELRAADRSVIRSIPVTLRLLSVGVQASVTASGAIADIEVEHWEGKRISDLLGSYYGFGGGMAILAGGNMRSTFSSSSGVTLGGYGLNTMSAGLGLGIAGYRLSVTLDGELEDWPLEKGGTPGRPTYDVEITGANIAENDASRSLEPFGGKPDPAVMVSAVSNDGAIWSSWTDFARDTFTPTYSGRVLSKLTDDALAHVVLHMRDNDVLFSDSFGEGCITHFEIGSGTAKCQSGAIPFEVSYRVVPHRD